MPADDHIHGVAKELFTADLTILGSTTETDPNPWISIPLGVRRMALMGKVTTTASDPTKGVVFSYVFIYRLDKDAEIVKSTVESTHTVLQVINGVNVAAPEIVNVPPNAHKIQITTVENESANGVSAVNLVVAL